MKPMRVAHFGSANLRSTPLSTNPVARRAATSGDIGMGSGAVVSAGEPNVTSESMYLPRRNAAVWYANMPPWE